MIVMKFKPVIKSKRRLFVEDCGIGDIIKVHGKIGMNISTILFDEDILLADGREKIVFLHLSDGNVELYPFGTECERLTKELEIEYNPHDFTEFTE